MAETKPIARKYDLGIGICFGHQPYPIPMIGYIETGSETVSTEFRPVARTFKDEMKGFCGHTGTIVSGSKTIFTMKEETARKLDFFIGTFIGIIITGSDTRNELDGPSEMKKNICKKYKDDPRFAEFCKDQT
jgi:hypothetical protein